MFDETFLLPKVKRSSIVSNKHDDLDQLAPNLGSQKIFFKNLALSMSLDIMVSYHHAQYQKKR